MITVLYRQSHGLTRQHTCFNYDYLNQEMFDDFVKEIKEKFKITVENSESFSYCFEHVTLRGIINCTDPIVKEIFSIAYFKHCAILNCDFSEVEFNSAIFNFCDIRHSRFSGNSRENNINMKLCNLICNKFNNQELSGDINTCILSTNEFNNTDLTFVDVSHCDFEDNDIDKKSGLYYPTACPKEGEFIGWKKCNYFNRYGIDRLFRGVCIVKLLIPSDAKRSSAFSNKCRCSKAKVLEIQNLDGSTACVDKVFSRFKFDDVDFVYKTGEWVYPDSFDENRFKECSNGIHFFMNREDAVRY